MSSPASLKKDPWQKQTYLSVLLIQADWNRTHGNLGRAEELLSYVLAATAKNLGTDNMEYLEILSCQAMVLGDQGREPESRKLYLQALGGYHKIAQEHENGGDFQAAEYVYRKALGIAQGILPASDELRIELSHCLGRLLDRDPVEQQRLLEQAVSLTEEYREPGYPNLPIYLYNLGLCYRAQGDAVAAQAMVERSLSSELNLAEPHHQHILDCVICLGFIHVEACRYAEAQPYFERAITLYERYNWTEYVAWVLGWLIWMHMLQGDYAQAERAAALRLHRLEGVLPADNQYLSTIRELLGECRVKLGKASEVPSGSKMENESAVESYLYDAISLAGDKRSAGAYQEAERILLNAWRQLEEWVGPEHVSVAELAHEMGMLCFDTHEHVRALMYLDAALSTARKTVGVQHPRTARYLETYATLMRVLNKRLDAEVMQISAEAIRQGCKR